MKRRRAITVFVGGSIIILLLAGAMPRLMMESLPTWSSHRSQSVSEGNKPTNQGVALDALEKLFVRGRAPKTGYERSQFGDGWSTVYGCSTRDIILHRDLENVQLENECDVTSGILNDPYTGKQIVYSKQNSSRVQIDHVVALSDTWKKGAQNLSAEQRRQLANDPLELLAVDGRANQQKSDADAATWLPSNKAFRCEYVARQIAIKAKYHLWVTAAEKDSMKAVLSLCPAQALP